MPRVCILLMDSFGIGASEDARHYGDEGANTFLSIARSRKATAPLTLPNLAGKGLYHALLSSSGELPLPYESLPEPTGLYGYAVEQSAGKDTPSGHWELAGVPVKTPWGYFPNTPKCFPEPLIHLLIEECQLSGVLGEKHASGTDIIEELGEEHIHTLKPIVYTSGDSVFQIAAHETAFGLERLYEVCEIARRLVDPYQIGRVIARPFKGEKKGSFQRTGNRRDYATLPPEPTLLDDLKKEGRDVIAIGKIADIFAHQGITQTIKADGNKALFDATIDAMNHAPDGSLVFTNFVDFDSLYGHRRNPLGYADALEAFDASLPELEALLRPDDVVVISADHGCDPTFPGSDHTREHVPVLMFGPNIKPRFIGRRDTFSDIGQTIADYLGISPLKRGISFR